MAALNLPFSIVITWDDAESAYSIMQGSYGELKDNIIKGLPILGLCYNKNMENTAVVEIMNAFTYDPDTGVISTSAGGVDIAINPDGSVEEAE